MKDSNVVVLCGFTLGHQVNGRNRHVENVLVVDGLRQETSKPPFEIPAVLLR